MKEDTHLVSLIVIFFIGWIIGSVLEERFPSIQITDLITATATFAAAFAAWYSAKIAINASDHAHEVELRSLLRDLNNTLQRIISETMRIGTLKTNVIRSQNELSMHMGQYGGTKQDSLNEGTEKSYANVIRFQQEARQLLEEQKPLREKNEKELTDLLLKHEGHLTQILRVKETLKEDLESFESENRVHREVAIKNITNSSSGTVNP